MKTVTISANDNILIELLRQALQEGLILRDLEGREFIVAEIDSFDREIELTRQNKRLMQVLDERAAQTNTVKLAEVKTQLGL
jgi:hypothetical protein